MSENGNGAVEVAVRLVDFDNSVHAGIALRILNGRAEKVCDEWRRECLKRWTKLVKLSDANRITQAVLAALWTEREDGERTAVRYREAGLYNTPEAIAHDRQMAAISARIRETQKILDADVAKFESANKRYSEGIRDWMRAVAGLLPDLSAQDGADAASLFGADSEFYFEHPGRLPGVIMRSVARAEQLDELAVNLGLKPGQCMERFKARAGGALMDAIERAPVNARAARTALC
jgi:hypothetical protein